MARKIPVYIPNISTDKLIDLLTANMDVDLSIVDLERLDKGAKFRAPDVAIIVHADSEQLVVRVVQYLIEAARIPGSYPVFY